MKTPEKERILEYSMKLYPSKKKIIIKVECNDMICYDDLRDVIDSLEAEALGDNGLN